MADDDRDGLSDELEQEYGTSRMDKDTDHDGLTDFAEHRLGTHPLWADSDGDGVNDGDEIAQHGDPVRLDRRRGPVATGREPTIEDPDGDGLDDQQEQQLGTDPWDPDSDGDGIGDRVESIRGTDPLNELSRDGSGKMLEREAIAGDLRAIRGRAPGEILSGEAGRFAMISAARAQEGNPYRFGAETRLDDKDPDAFDSSELVEWAAAQAGIKLPDGSWNQYQHLHAGGNAVSVEQALRTKGALVFGFSSDPLAATGRPQRAYVAISLGDGRVLDVSERAGEVREMDAGNFYTHGAVIPELVEDLGPDGAAPASVEQGDVGADPLGTDAASQPTTPAPADQVTPLDLVAPADPVTPSGPVAPSDPVAPPQPADDEAAGDGGSVNGEQAPDPAGESPAGDGSAEVPALIPQDDTPVDEPAVDVEPDSSFAADTYEPDLSTESFDVLTDVTG